MCVGVPSPVLVGPGELDDDTIAPRPDRIERVVAITKLPFGFDSAVEDLTGLVGTVSGRRPPESRQPAPSAPLHVGMDQGDERLHVAVTERLIRSANRLNRHTVRLLR